MHEGLATEAIRSGSRPFERVLAWLDHRRLFALVILLSAVVYAQYDPLTQPVRRDRANWDYFSQVIARGGIPYRDVVNIKTPLSAYIGAAAIVAARPFGVKDVHALRLVCFAMLLLTAGMTFLVAYEYLGSRSVALLAALIMLAFNIFGQANAGGIQPKTPMILFGLMALWAIKKDYPFLAGLFGMLSALVWQPGLLFVGAAGLAFSRYLTSWRDLKVVRMLAGAMLPLAIQILHLWLGGGLRDFYQWTIHFNYSVYAPGGVKTFPEFLGYIARMARGPYRPERIYFLLAVCGIVVLIYREIKKARNAGAGSFLAGAAGHSLIIAPLVYLLFCLTNVQAAGDVFPFLPFVAIFSAFAIVALLDLSKRLFLRLRPQLDKEFYPGIAFAFACFLVFIMSVADSFFYGGELTTLQQQEEDVREIKSHLLPGDKIFVHGATEILVVGGLTNASRHFFLDREKDVYLNQVEPGGFNGWLERLKADRPKIVALDRLRWVRYEKAFAEWVSQDYEIRQGRVFTYYLRKE